MINKIANLIASSISTLNYVERIGGLVKPIRKNIQGTEQIMPGVYHTPEQCDSSKYTIMTPDIKVKSVIYFEGDEAVVESTDARYVNWSWDATLVCWCNLGRINQSLTDANTIAANLMKELPRTLPNTDYLTKIRVFIDGYGKNEAVFGAYTYNEQEQQRLVYPYDWFTLDLRVVFSVPIDCPGDITIDSTECLL